MTHIQIMTKRPTLIELESQINAAAQAAARKAGRVAAPLTVYTSQDPHYNCGGFSTTCKQTATYAASWLNARRCGTQDYGKPMTVHLYNVPSGYQVRVYEYTIGD